jgi:hypothetical protein
MRHGRSESVWAALYRKAIRTCLVATYLLLSAGQAVAECSVVTPERRMRRAIILAAWIIVSAPQIFCLPGCAVYMAANQPDKKDVGVLKAGNARNAVIAELGTPIQTTTRSGARVDLSHSCRAIAVLRKEGALSSTGSSVHKKSTL